MDNALKALDRTDDSLTVGNYIVLFGDEKTKDLDAEFFDKATTLESAYTQLGRFPVDWEHGFYAGQGEPGREMLGYVDWTTAKADDKGVFVRRVLDRRNEYIKTLDEAGLFDAGLMANSSEADPRGVKVAANGHIKAWPLIKDTLTVAPMEPRMLTENQMRAIKSLTERLPGLKALLPKAAGDAATESATADAGEPMGKSKQVEGINNMTENVENKAATPAPSVDVAAIAAEAAKQAADAAVKAYQAQLEKDAGPVNGVGIANKGVNVAKHADAWKYDNYSPADLSFTLDTVGKARGNRERPNADMVKALALRLESSEADDEDELPTGAGRAMKTIGPNRVARNAMKRAGVKADETNFSTNASYGDEWIGVAYSGDLWAKVRQESGVVQRLPTYEFPAGAESAVMALESTDPIWYLVAQAGDPTSGTAQVTNTVPAKALGTAQVSATLGKLGGATIYTGEMVEDAFVPFAAQLRNQIAVSGAEYLESAIIDGDTATTTTTNINDIGGTPGATDWFLIWNGFRKSPLVTTTANSRDGGVLTAEDFLETVKLMGVAGKVGFDRNRVSFLLPPPTHWKALELADLKTRDVYANPTIENGNLVRIWGYEVLTSYQYNFSSTANTSYEYKENTAGKVDIDTASNNTKGSILAVRWDHWKLGYRRRMTIELERIPRADAWEITSIMRASLVQRDTEASAITYNLTV